jgi:hypothetical protein
MLGPKTLRQAFDAALSEGYTHTFKAEADVLRCLETGERLRPAQVKIVHHERFEGPSSEDDEEVLYLIESDTGLRGTLVDAYGTYADTALGEFLCKARVEELPYTE